MQYNQTMTTKKSHVKSTFRFAVTYQKGEGVIKEEKKHC